MFFYMPSKVYQEKDAVRKHAAEWCQAGSRALIVTGRNSARICGALADVTEALDGQNRTWCVFDEVEENPSVETVQKAAVLGLEEGCDFVIGIGGGSPMDAAKAISLLMYRGCSDAEQLYQPGDSSAYPVIAVPTTCGTGSETTPYAILTRWNLNKKKSIPYKIFPAYSLVDSRYLAFAPEAVRNDTAIDALGHLLESYINANATDYSRMASEQGLAVWAKSKEVLLGSREASEEDLENMLLASSMAGMAISLTTTSLPHGLSYPMTCERGFSHGKGVGYFQAGYLREAPKDMQQRLLGLAGFADAEELDRFYRKVCNPPEVEPAFLQGIADAMLEDPARLAICPYPVDRKVLYRMVGIE